MHNVITASEDVLIAGALGIFVLQLTEYRVAKSKALFVACMCIPYDSSYMKPNVV